MPMAEDYHVQAETNPDKPVSSLLTKNYNGKNQKNRRC